MRGSSARGGDGEDSSDDAPLPDALPESDEDSAAPLYGVASFQHPLGKYHVPWVEQDGMAVADDVVLGPVDQFSTRDAAVANIDLWPAGVIPYVWEVDADDGTCGGQNSFCVDEYDTYEAGGFMDEVRRRLHAQTPLKLVNVTHCYNDDVSSWRSCSSGADCAPYETCDSGFCACESEELPAAFLFLRPQDSTIGTYGGDPSCDPDDNRPASTWTFNITNPGAGTWSMSVSEDGGGFQSVGSYVATGNDGAGDIRDGLVAAFSRPNMTAAADEGATGIFEAMRGVVPFEVQVQPPMQGSVDISETTAPCERHCENVACAAGDVCQQSWDGQTEDWGDDRACAINGGLATAVGFGSWMYYSEFPRLKMPRVRLEGPSPGYSLFLHELLHIAGFFHEQNRSDAGDYITLLYDELQNGSCAATSADVDPSMNPLPVEGWAVDFDFGSLMQYSSSTLCAPRPDCDGWCLVARDDAGCDPATVCTEHPEDSDYMWIKPSAWTQGTDENAVAGEANLTIANGGYSYGDLDAIRMLHGSGLGGQDAFSRAFEQAFSSVTTWYGPEDLDLFGYVLATGRLGDEHQALLVGVPDEDDDGDVGGSSTWNAGGVAVYEGTQYALNPIAPALPTHSASHWLRPVQPAEYGDFGRSILAADIDCDGVAEVFVGAPRQGDYGQVQAFELDAGSPDPRWKRDQPTYTLEPDDGNAGDKFGHALAAADVTGDNCPELLVGAPYSDEADTNAGLVFIYERSGTSVDLWDVVGDEATVTVSGQRFGESIAAIDLDGDGKDGLAIGATGWNSQRGRVYVYTDPGAGTFDSTEHVATLQAPGAPPANSAFGRVLAVADFEQSAGDPGDQDLVVGAPLLTSGATQAGGVFVYAGIGNDVEVLTSPTQATGGLDTQEYQDWFGSAVAATDEFVFVAAPGEGSTVSKHGAVYQYEYISEVPYGIAKLLPSDTTAECDGIHPWTSSTDESDWYCDESFDPLDYNAQFGRSLVATETWLAAGAPYWEGATDPSAMGAIYVFSRTSGDTFTPAHKLTQGGSWPIFPVP